MCISLTRFSINFQTCPMEPNRGHLKTGEVPGHTWEIKHLLLLMRQISTPYARESLLCFTEHYYEILATGDCFSCLYFFCFRQVWQVMQAGIAFRHGIQYETCHHKDLLASKPADLLSLEPNSSFLARNVRNTELVVFFFVDSSNPNINGKGGCFWNRTWMGRRWRAKVRTSGKPYLSILMWQMTVRRWLLPFCSGCKTEILSVVHFGFFDLGRFTLSYGQLLWPQERVSNCVSIDDFCLSDASAPPHTVR